MRKWMRWLQWTIPALSTGALALMGAGPAAAEQCENVSPWINEIDYDDDYRIILNWDREEFVEIAGAAGTDLGGYRVVVIEGSTDGLCWSGFGTAGEAYIDEALPAGTVLADAGGGIGYLSVCITDTSSDVAHCDVTIQGAASDSNLKNGSLTSPAGNCADGILVLDDQGNLVDAVGYEGQVANTGTFGGYFQPAVTPYYLFPPIYDDGYDARKSVMRNDDATERATSQSQWSVSAINGASPGGVNTGQSHSCDSTPTPVCGNGVPEAGEECDDGNTVPGDGCSDLCIIEFCGDGTLQAGLGETCDDGNTLSEDGCSDTCQAEFCGDGTLQAGLGESCDDGNTADGDCCSSSCGFEAAGSVCRASAGVCDVAETCTGSSGTCPADDLAAAGTECRASVGLCDVAETCTGSDAACPADDFVSAGVVCRSPTGACDVAETCSGADAACPLDGFAPAGLQCRASAGLCDVAETCSGTGKFCPTDDFVAAGTECRASAGVCDVTETCSGSSATCPADGFVGAGAECRAAAGACDVAEACSGSDAACPADGFAGAGTECRASAGDCDVAEACTGSDAACPADGFAPPTTTCRPAVGACDASELCTGSSASCPADSVLDGVPCLDGSVCNGDETCVAGICTSGTALDCDDLDPCTADGCDAVSGCFSTPIEGCGVSAVPSLDGRGQLLLALSIVTLGGLALAGRRRELI